MTRKMFALFLALLLCLAACGKVVPTTAPESPSAPAETGAAETPPVADAGSSAEAETPSEAAQGAAPAQETSPAQSAEPAEPAEQTAFRPGAHLERVENNGSEFVWVNGIVYYRLYGADTLRSAALFGDFLSNPNVDGGGESTIVFDLNAVPLFTTAGWGPLYYGNGGFYLQEPGDGQPLVCWYAPDGSERREIGPGTILGVSEGGDLLAAQTYSWETGSAVTLYRNGEESAVLRPGNRGFVYAGLMDAGLFYLERDYSSGELRFCELAADGSTEPIVLGLVPMPDYEVSVEVDDFAAAGGKVGVIAGYYAGTGHFLNDYAAVQARVGTASSLSLLYESAGNDYIDFTPRLQPDDAGTFHLVEHLSGEFWTDLDGGLRYWTGEAEALLLPDAELRAEDGRGFCRFVQKAELVEGAAYILTADCLRSPGDSVGWREGFRLLGLTATRIDMTGSSIGSLEPPVELWHVDCGAVLTGRALFVVDALPEPEAEEPDPDGDEAAEAPAPEPEPLEPTALLFFPYAADGSAQMGPVYGYVLDFAPGMVFSAGDWADLSEAAAAFPIVLTEEPGYEGYYLDDDAPALSVALTLDREGRITALGN